MIPCKLCLEPAIEHTYYNKYCTHNRKVYTDNDHYTPMDNLEYLEYCLENKK